jgi:hypothetical protein
MSKPSIGTVATPAYKEEQKREIRNLTVLEEDSNKSIFSLIFSQAGNRETKKNEQ